jgi:hypothetical protein
VVPKKRINLSLPDVPKKRNIPHAVFGLPKKRLNCRNWLLAKRLM